MDRCIICSNCAKDEALKRYIINNSTGSGKCSICKKASGYIVDIESDHKIIQLFYTLVRYYYTGFDYDSHLGGSDFYALFTKENPILNHEFVMENEDDQFDSDELIGAIFDKDCKGVSLFGFQSNIRDASSKLIMGFENQLINTNYFKVEEEAVDIFRDVEKYIVKKIYKGKNFYRASILSTLKL